jgi:hypothetical protein
MSQPTDSRSSETSNDPRKIGKWARAYAQNRSLGMVVFMVIFVTLCLMMAGFPILAVLAYRSEQWIPFGICIVMIVVALGGTFYLSVPRWGGKLQERIVERLYAKEGTVRLAPPQTRGRKRMTWLLAIAFGACILASIALSGWYHIPEKYMQPISAIYCVPFLVGLYFLQRPATSPISLLWPVLYGLHAILIVAGAPIVFVGCLSSLNVLIPMAGYGMLVGLIGHAYSRFALRKLRRAAGECLDESAEEPRP